jgi:hypothetical protein
MKVTRFGVCGHLISGGAGIAFKAYGWQECAMLSKCANSECSETLRYLHQGKIFCLSPTPNAEGKRNGLLQERFWLCSQCSKEMTLIWCGKQVRLVPLPISVVPLTAAQTPKDQNKLKRRRLGGRAASASREDV